VVRLTDGDGKVYSLLMTLAVDAPTVMTQITGVKLSDNSFQITSSGLSDADGEITSLLYIATNTRTGQQLSSANGRFENLDWGDWVVITTGMAKDGATGALQSVRNDLAYRTTIAQLIAPNEGGPVISIPTVNAFSIEYYPPENMWVSLTSLGGTGHGDQKNDITISNFGAFDPDGIASFVVTSQLFGELYR
jgi:hypothetical protein